MSVKSVKVWTGKNKEQRVYVKDARGFESVLYLTGNNWNLPGSKAKQGKWGIADEDWQEAEQVAFADGQWTNYPAPQPKEYDRSSTCPDCGGPNCSPVRCDG